MNFPLTMVCGIVFSQIRPSFGGGSSTVLVSSILVMGLYAIHPNFCLADPNSSTQDFASSPLTISSTRDSALEERKAVLIKTLNGQKKAGKLRVVDDPVYQNSFDGCNFHRKEKVTYYGQSFGGTSQTTTSEVEITFDVTTLTKIESSFDVGAPEIRSVLFASDSASIDIQVDSAVFHHSDQLIAVDDAQSARTIVDAFDYIRNSCKARPPAVLK